MQCLEAQKEVNVLYKITLLIDIMISGCHF